MDGLSIKNSNLNQATGRIAGGPPLSSPVRDLQAGESSFADTLKSAVGKVNELQQQADVKMQQLATGETTDIADVKIAAEKADIALRLMTSVRNKMIDAYHEIMKMQV
ncbi:flagellar hook-basal body complex protein FliE [bacterium]|nr:flagellar hook-basal body complex protein FliE [bacterium]